MAMLPFCGYHMGDYFEHWLNMGKRMTSPPKIFHVNWFRTDENGKFLWPGYGENLRVIEWILDRCRGEADAVKTPIGYVPTPDSLDLTGLDISREALDKLFAVNRDDWYEETDNVASFFQQFGNALPASPLGPARIAAAAAAGADLADEAGRRTPPVGRRAQRSHRAGEPARLRACSPTWASGSFSPRASWRKRPRPRRRPSATTPPSASPAKTASRCTCHRHAATSTTSRPAEALTYAPATGRPDLRKKWREDLLRKNPSLAGKSFSMPIVTSGVTHALSLVGDLFVDKGDMVLVPDKFWENYELLFGVRYQAQLGALPVLQRRRRLQRRGPAAGPGHPGGKLEDGAGAQLPQQSHRLLHHQVRSRAGRAGPAARPPTTAATWSWSATTPTSACSTTTTCSRSRSSPGWPAATSGSWP